MTVFRFSDLDLRDPHTFLNFFVCRDFTDTTIFGFSANSYFQDAVQKDSGSDGFLDTNYLLVFKPLDPTGSGTMEVHTRSSCTAPLASPICDSTLALITLTTYSTSGSGECLAAFPGTLHPYTPAITYPNAPCFASGTFDLTLTIAGILLTLRDVTMSGTFVGNPATSITNGFMRGFINESDANVSILPSSIPLIGGKSLSSILPGGTGCCASVSDKDTNRGVSGWWFYFNFTAPQVTYLGP